jgi:hypothetical protein
MSCAIIQALRPCGQLKGNTFLIATEIAHRMNNAGYGRVSYQFLAWKAHCCRQTAITQVARLVDDYRLFRKHTFRTPHGNAINLYQYIGPRVHTASPPVTAHGQTLRPTLPEAEREKDTSLRQDLEQQKKGLRFWTPGSLQWTRSLEEITRLEGVLMSETCDNPLA